MAQMIEIEVPDALAAARTWLQMVRSSSPTDAAFTVSQDIMETYGSVKDREVTSTGDAERDLLQYALAVANSETDVSGMQRAILAGRAGISGVNAVPRIASAVPVTRQAEIHLQAVSDARQRLRDFMESVMEDRTAARKRIDPQALEHVWSLPELRGGSLTHHLVVLDLAAFEALVAVLLVTREFGEELRRCRSTSCTRFFFRERTRGRSRDIYCSPSCYDNAHDKERDRRKATKSKRHK